MRIVPLLSWMGKLKLRERVYLGVEVKHPAVSFRAFPTAQSLIILLGMSGFQKVGCFSFSGISVALMLF